MVAIKNADADAFAARPDAARPIVLLYGPDAGLVRERAERIIRGSVDDLNDPFALVRMEGDDLASNPSRLPEEAHTVPLFGGKRAIWIKAGGRNFALAVEMVLATPPVDCRIVIEAGELRKTSPLRTACEKAKAAAAVVHDHVIAIYSVDVSGPVPFLVMPYIAGRSLFGIPTS